MLYSLYQTVSSIWSSWGRYLIVSLVDYFLMCFCLFVCFWINKYFLWFRRLLFYFHWIFECGNSLWPGWGFCLEIFWVWFISVWDYHVSAQLCISEFESVYCTILIGGQDDGIFLCHIPVVWLVPYNTCLHWGRSTSRVLPLYEDLSHNLIF